MKKLVFATNLSLVLTVFAVVSGLQDIPNSSPFATPVFAATGASKEKPFYEGKTITFISAAASGGGTDVFSRLIARFLPRHIPGNPNIIVQNMPGGNGLVGANHVYTKAKPDGLTILTASGAALVEAQRLGTKGVLFDVTRMHVLVGTATGTVCFVSPETGIREPRDLINPKVDLFRGGQSRSIGSSLESDIPMEEIFRVKRYRAIYGYDSLGPARLAFMRGETNMHCDSTLSYGDSVVQEMIQKGRAVPVFQTGLLGPGGKLTRHPGAANVPTVAELHQQIYGTLPSGIAWEVLRDQLSGRSFGKIMAFSPETPLQRTQELEQALRDLVKNSEWIAETTRVTGEALVPPLVIIGEQVQQVVRDYMRANPEITRWLDNWVKGK